MSSAAGAGPAGLRAVVEAGVRSDFQPIVDLDSGCVVAYEALARGPRGSALETPAALFAAARSQGLLEELDRACRAAAFRGAVTAGLRAPLTLFVNVEPEALDEAPLDELAALVEEAPEQLRVVVEITERALAARPAELLRTVDRVRELGWGVALDDVGANPLSLTFMPLLRPDVVKLDLRVVQDRPGPAVAQVMNAVNAYAEEAGALVLAEGIEDQRHLRRGRALGARLGQGWLFGRPRPGPVEDRPAGALTLPAPPSDLGGDTSPFALLRPGTVLRRSPKSLLVELSKQLEREAMRRGETVLVASTFQEAKHLTPGARARYRDLVERTGLVCALGEGLSREPMPGVRGAELHPRDPVRGEWDVVVLGTHFSAALLGRDLGDLGPDSERGFEYALTYERATVVAAARSLLSRVAPRSELGEGAGRAAAPAPTRLAVADHAVADHAVAVAGQPVFGHAVPDEPTPYEPVPDQPVPGQPVPDQRVAGAPLAAPVGASRPPHWPSDETLLLRALDATTSGVAIADMTLPDQPLVYVNAAFERLSGLRAEEALGRNCRLLQGADTDRRVVDEMRAAIAAGKEHRATVLNLRGPGRVPWWNEVYLAPVRDESGRVVQYIGVQHDVTERVQAQRQLELERDRAQSYLARIERLAYTDPLTGLANRRSVEERIEVALADAERGGHVLALLFCDLDGFKAVNDAHGHAVGDDLLVAVASRLRERVRRTDLVARMGGDEFLVALPGLDQQTAAQDASRLATALAADLLRPVVIGGVEVVAGASIGIALAPRDGRSFGELLHHADQRMYVSKRARPPRFGLPRQAAPLERPARPARPVARPRPAPAG
ncbi:diguanylate cyclase domain-containing protein [Pseudokineococcus sp. 1T1Z-3]|uniref:diguanylate cyclase domain-containing protein n=1 Tax=Pseudokineococcus sp. 1T1Z-3 TaxID=3132745 RepID=UPI0030B43FAB